MYKCQFNFKSPPPEPVRTTLKPNPVTKDVTPVVFNGTAVELHGNGSNGNGTNGNPEIKLLPSSDEEVPTPTKKLDNSEATMV